MKTVFLEGEGRTYDILFSSKLLLNSTSHKAVMSQVYKLVLRKDWCSLPHSTHIYSNGVKQVEATGSVKGDDILQGYFKRVYFT